VPGERTYDLVLFGASGFTGALTADYLARNAPAGTRWALAGRSTQKLKARRAELAALNPACADLPLLNADVEDAQSIGELASAAKVLITTVGPYVRYGEPLVAACAQAGTDYVDLTGEPEFVDLMYTRYHAAAVKSGARIVHCCGFDSIPHDLGAYFTVKQLPEGVPIKLEGFVRAGGRPSGGTAHSAITAFSRVRQTSQAAKERRRLEEPATPARRARLVKGMPRRDAKLNAWVLPMPTIDPQIVRRSAQALERYGPDFSYGHYIALRRLPVAAGLVGGVGALMLLSQLPPTRSMLLSAIKPGDGPSVEQRAKGWFKVRFVGEGGGKRVVAEVSGGDPGYGETAKMLAESALCLAFDDLPKTSGQLTTATAMGDALIKRLRSAGIAFEICEGG